jgi:hypothetical protein
VTASIHQRTLESGRFAAKAVALPNTTAGVPPTREVGRLSRRVQSGIACWRPKHATRQAPGPEARRRRDQTPEQAAHSSWMGSPAVQRFVLVLATVAGLVASPLDAERWTDGRVRAA